MLLARSYLRRRRAPAIITNAVKLANSRGGQGAVATGMGAVVCVQQDMKRPLSVGDLQKGERWWNVYSVSNSVLITGDIDTLIWIILCYQHLHVTHLRI